MLSGSEERLRAILNTAVDAIITIDERGTVESVNQAAGRLFGYAHEDMVGQNVKMLMPMPYCDEHDGYLANYLGTGVRKIIGIGRQVEGRRKDGSTFPMDLAVSEISLGQKRLFTGIVRDLTERQKAEEVESNLGRILEESLNEIYIFDAGTLRFLQVNRGARENMGLSMAELAERTPLDIKPGHTPDTFAELIQPLRTGEREIVQFETQHRRKDGSHYDVEVHVQMARYQEKPAFVAIIVDTTERKKAEELLRTQQQELRQLNEELEDRVRLRTSELQAAHEELVRQEKLASLGQLAGTVAHEIRNPLGIIKNAAYFLESISDNKDEDVRDSFGEINRALSTSNRIVSELLDYARDPKIEVVEFASDDVVERALSAASVPEHISVQHERAGSSLRLRADVGQIERILFNLIQNAAQAMPAGGSLVVRYVATMDSKVAIEVEDTGEGISPDELHRVFEPLYSRRVKGVGLGLALSKRYAELNHGSLSVESNLGRGSTFRLTLPRAGRTQGT